MLKVRQWTRPLREILQGPDVPAELQAFAATVMPFIVSWTEWPDVAIEQWSGIFTAPTQRLMMHQHHRGAAENVNVSSRGTAKSATICVLYDTYLTIVSDRRKHVMLNGTGYRGGVMMFSDIERWVAGGWDSQREELPFLAACAKRRTGTSKNFVQRGPNWQLIETESYSSLATYPTTDEDSIRGIRGHVLFIDEANIFEPTVLAKVVEPFTNVLGDFEHGGAKAQANAIHYTSTIDYAWRPFQDRVRAARDGVARDYEAHLSRQRGDEVRYAALERQGLHDFTYTSFDYTDCLIPEEITTRDGRRFLVRYPNPKIEAVHDPHGIPFSIRRPDGRLQLEGAPGKYYRTYPTNKVDIERKLLTGQVDESMWLAEQRNVVDTATGDVYPHNVLERVSCEREPMIAWKNCSAAWKAAHKEWEEGYSPTVLFRCTDPVVIGIDYAGGERDFCAFVVIRVGPLAEGEFNPFTGHGRTGWSNVIWCEQQRQMSHGKVAEKLYELMERYPNLAWHYDPVEDDTWKLCRAVGLDMKGGGTGVRDALVFIDKEHPPPGKQRILDPLDQDSRIQAFLKDPKSLKILDAIQPSDMLNDRCVEFTKGQMGVGQLWLPRWLDGSERAFGSELEPSYAGQKVLLHQLRKIQQKPTKNYRMFFMPGSEELPEGKKDLFSAFLYAAKQLRAHLIRHQMIVDVPPPTSARRTQIGRKRGRHGRSPGAKY